MAKLLRHGKWVASRRTGRGLKMVKLEYQLDSLVIRAEQCGKDTQTRRNLMERADFVRSQLRLMES